MQFPHRISVHSALSARAVAILAVLAFAVLYAHYLSRPAVVYWTGLVAIAMTAYALHVVRGQANRIELNPARDELTIFYRSWLGKASAHFVLSSFSAVRTYTRGGPLGVTIVELSSAEDLPRAIRIATFDERFSSEARFFAVPRSVEAPGAAALRAQLAATGLFRDEGYCGEFLERRAQDVA